jgi:hypothetical protein
MTILEYSGTVHELLISLKKACVSGKSIVQHYYHILLNVFKQNISKFNMGLKEGDALHNLFPTLI